jgi:hypothetical protein
MMIMFMMMIKCLLFRVGVSSLCCFDFSSSSILAAGYLVLEIRLQSRVDVKQRFCRICASIKALSSRLVFGVIGQRFHALQWTGFVKSTQGVWYKYCCLSFGPIRTNHTNSWSLSFHIHLLSLSLSLSLFHINFFIMQRLLASALLTLFALGTSAVRPLFKRKHPYLLKVLTIHNSIPPTPSPVI